MHKSTECYLVAFIIFICSTIWTVGMVLLYTDGKLIIASVPFVIMCIVPVSGYATTIWMIFIGHEYQVLEKHYRR